MATVTGTVGAVLLYGDSPPADEPTLELLRRPLPADQEAAEACRVILGKALGRWGWEGAMDAADGCLSAVLHAITAQDPDTVELFAFRRAHQLTVELHFTGAGKRFHQMLNADPHLGVIDTLAPLWGVRPLADGEAVWFEFRAAC